MQRQNKPNFIVRLARWSSEHRKAAILGWITLLVVLFGVVMNAKVIETQRLTTAESVAGGAGDAEELLTDAGLRPTSEVVFIQSTTTDAKDPAFKAVIHDSAKKLAATKNVENVTTPLDGSGGAYSDDGHSAFIEFEIAGDVKDVATDVEPSIATVEKLQEDNPAYRVEQFGSGSSEKALQSTLQSDVGKAGMLSLPITLIVLLIALGALVAASVPLVLAIVSVLTTMAIVAIPSQIFPLDGNTDALILLIGLAVGVDYSLFYIRREREERAAGRTTKEALEVAAATSGRAVFISGLTVMIAMAGMFITGDATFISFAVATISVVAVAMTSTLVVLPAVLAWLGDRVEKGRIPLTARKRKAAGRESRFWVAITALVMRHPVASVALAGGFLLALTIPALGMNTVQTGTDDLPQDLAVVQTYERFTNAFPQERNAVEVVVEAGNVTSGPIAAAIDDLVSKAKAAGVAIGKSTVEVSKDHTVADVGIPTAGNGTDEASFTALDKIRNDLAPATVGSVDGATVLITGGAAESGDFSDLLAERMPLVFAFVLGLAFLLLMVTFRSIVIPIKAIILNMLSVGAAYGVLVLVFQEGWGENLLGFTSNAGVTNWLPLFLFVILFGLSMDYHVFILTRVRELYDRGYSTDDSVQKGIAGSAGTVTAAAAVMVLVFSVFATLSFIDFKEMGVGLAVAILIDATIIRGVLLPASMKLLGDWNWYLPSWLEWLPRIEGETPEGTASHAPQARPVET